MKQTPAEFVIKSFGGVRQTARILGINPTAVSHWKVRRPKRGEKGLIPSWMHRKILKKAQRLKLPITSYELVWGSRT